MIRVLPSKTTPPGTVPLMEDPYNREIHELNRHTLGFPCLGSPYADDCQHIGFRVVDAEKFESWLRSITIRPNMHEIEYEIEYEPVDLFDAEYE